MGRFAPVLVLMVACGTPLAAQSPAGDLDRPAAHPPQTVAVQPETGEPPSDEPADSLFAGRPASERALRGAIVGAVVGAALTTQDSDCAPASSPGRASVVGGALGALRGLFGLRSRDDPPPLDRGNGGGAEAPFPFEGRRCEPEDPS